VVSRGVLGRFRGMGFLDFGVFWAFCAGAARPPKKKSGQKQENPRKIAGACLLVWAKTGQNKPKRQSRKDRLERLGR
jgi:hypothetical protein